MTVRPSRHSRSCTLLVARSTRSGVVVEEGHVTEGTTIRRTLSCGHVISGVLGDPSPRPTLERRFSPFGEGRVHVQSHPCSRTGKVMSSRGPSDRPELSTRPETPSVTTRETPGRGSPSGGVSHVSRLSEIDTRGVRAGVVDSVPVRKGPYEGRSLVAPPCCRGVTTTLRGGTGRNVPSRGHPPDSGRGSTGY